MKTIRIVGLGYVGLANFCYFLKGSEWSRNLVFGYDINSNKIKTIEKGHSPIVDPDIENCLLAHKDNLPNLVSDDLSTIGYSDILVLCLPTNYDEKSKAFDVSAFLNVAEKVQHAKYIIVRSTVDSDGWDKIVKAFAQKSDNILYMPEFLREGSALSDEIYGKKCICTDPHSDMKRNYIKELFLTKPIKFCSSKEAILVKLASNAYLATRVAFFNEIDSYCLEQGLNSKRVIEYMGMDKRIGKEYCRPSFGFGGYCLPKDSKVLAEMTHSPLLNILQKSNTERAFRIYNVVKTKIEKDNPVIGFYRLSMKPNSDNIRETAALSVMDWFIDDGYTVIVYEPLLSELPVERAKLVNDFDEFVQKSDFILSDFDYSELKKIKTPKLIMGA